VQLQQRRVERSFGLAPPARNRLLGVAGAQTKRALTLVPALLLSFRGAALACGVSGSGAPAGICDASEVLDEKAAAARDRVGLSYGYTSSVLFFSDGSRDSTERHAVMASWEHPLPGRWTFEAGAGSLLGGYVGAASFSPGVLAAVSLSHLVAPPRGRYAAPFLLLSFTLAGVWAQLDNAKAQDYVAFDFSAALAAGSSIRIKTHTVTPFIAGRLFGGPVFWQGAVGSDAYHYSLGPGLAVGIARSRVGLSFGCSVLGEKNIKGGVTVAF